jgi:dienelactone hydrolase
MTLRDSSKQRYYLYIPQRITQSGRLFVTVHGISRNAREHAERFASLAAQQGVVLVAPRFGRRRFGSYQRLAPDAKGRRPDRLLDAIVAEVRGLLGLPDGKLYLFGFSGGGQFVHRYAMAHPAHVARVVVGAAGWYTFPDPRARYPRGLRLRSAELPQLDDLGFLQVPMAVVVGGDDIERDPALNQAPRIDRQQGMDRCDRGRRWVAAMQQAAQTRGLSTRYRFEVLPGVGHDFTRAMELGGMGQAVFDYLFGAHETAPGGREYIAAAALPGVTRYPAAGTPGGSVEDRRLVAARDMCAAERRCGLGGSAAL